MPKTKEQKKQIINSLIDKFNKAKAVVFVSFNALGVKENEELRQSLRQEQSEYYVAKKTLLDLALRDSKIGGGNVKTKEFEGRVATVFGYGDEVAPAKIIDKFRKSNKEKVEFIGGILENKFIEAAQVAELAGLPGKQELYAKVVGSINAPISGFVNALCGNLRNLVYVLKAIEEKK
ncbi:50S ribosomal protein L10 [Patescibacteria group bacterium]|nr:50S ribosomal protein L10 [Patescibacteria group bacterium]MBU4347666.1 50S ribosomal protein L10 [Patescibacteria group bacterium]MBU4455419.1 50S ribosomal protein L10 [Patescibacteria group bacterium]MCG2690618.1 50S ribosomal protein L10 [Candidatus Parcubacteria bacterium]